MLRQYLVGAGASACLTSPRLLDYLSFVLLHNTSIIVEVSHEGFHDRCQAILREELDREEPRRFRTTDIGQAVRTLWPATMFLGEEGAVIPFLEAFAAQLFVRTDTVVHFRDDAIDEYTRLSARIDPALVLCWKIEHDVMANDLDRDAIEALVASVQPFCTQSTNGAAVYADNHVHLGGASSEQLILMAALSGGRDSSRAAAPQIAEELDQVRQLAHGLLRLEGDLDDKDVCELAKDTLTLHRYFKTSQEVHWPSLKEQMEAALHARTDGGAALSKATLCKYHLASSLCNHDLSRAWLWFLLWCFSQYQDKSSGPMRRIAIFILIGTIMRVRQRMVVDGYGYGRFDAVRNERKVDHSISSLLRKDAVERVFRSADDVAELKVATGQVKRNFVRNLLGLLLPPDGMKSASATDVEQACARWHFCVYFSRSETSAWEEAKQIAKLIQMQNQWIMASDEHEEGSEPHKLQPARLVRALDVAGDENLSKIEVFAPALRWLRGIARRDGQKLLLSIHAGEDYAHPLSGMRHIDETVQFCEMGYGDRIGHGLALGITAKKWFDERGQAMLTVDEYLDNQVWAWHYATKYPSLPGASDIAKSCETAVQELAGAIGWLDEWKLGAPTMSDLRDAWQLRRNCPRLAFDEIKAESRAKSEAAVPDATTFDDMNAEPVRLFASRHLWFNGLQKLKTDLEKRKKDSTYTVQITCTERNDGPKLQRHEALELFTAIETPASLEFMEALQDLLIEKCRKRRLVFEVNPTSNRHIGPLSELRDHPIFRWNPPEQRLLEAGRDLNRFKLRSGPLQVCVNTDDPGIMPTTLRTEFELLRHAALDHGIEPEAVNRWLRQLRRKGVRLFRAARRHAPAAVGPHWMDLP